MNNIDLKDKLVSINRITKVVKGGRRFAFSALVVVGNQTGSIGIGYGKAKQVPNAIKKAFSPENYYAGRAGTGSIASTGTTYPTELQYKADNAKKGIKGLTPEQKKKISDQYIIATDS